MELKTTQPNFWVLEQWNITSARLNVSFFSAYHLQDLSQLCTYGNKLLLLWRTVLTLGSNCQCFPSWTYSIMFLKKKVVWIGTNQNIHWFRRFLRGIMPVVHSNSNFSLFQVYGNASESKIPWKTMKTCNQVLSY